MWSDELSDGELIGDGLGQLWLVASVAKLTPADILFMVSRGDGVRPS